MNDPAHQDDHETRQMRREWDRAGVSTRYRDDRIRCGQRPDRRDMIVISADQYPEHMGLTEGQIYVRKYATEDGEEHCVESWAAAEARHMSGPYETLDEAADAWLEAVKV